MKKFLVLVAACMLLISCNDKENQVVLNNDFNESLVNNVIENEVITEPEVIEEVEVIDAIPLEEAIDLTDFYREHKVNEVGQVLVIMYHNLAEKPGLYASTPDLFRGELERLYEEGYRTISMSELIDNRIDVPAGTTPVVLTFDDGHISNFYYEEDGSIGKDSVVGIMDAFYEVHPDFGRNAIFYLNKVPFKDKELAQQKLDYLVANGYEIGNHTIGHADLKKQNAEGIQKQLGAAEANVLSYLPDYPMKHLSLPFGHRPEGDLENYVWSGSYDGTSYAIESAVNVGWNPISSPAHHKFNPRSINRITCGEGEARLDFWLDILQNNPERRYYSDGNPDTVVVPVDKADDVKDVYSEMLITYEQEEDM